MVALLFSLGSPRGAEASVWATGPVTDQGNSPSCVGHALIGLIHAEPIHSYTSVDPEELYERAREIDGVPDDVAGTTVRAGLQALEEWGWIERWDITDTYTQTLDMLAHGPVVLETDWRVGESYPDPLDHIHPAGPVQGRHAILVYGDSTEYVFFQNSWGNWWGWGDGRASMSRAEFRELFSRDGAVAYQVYVRAHTAAHGAPSRGAFSI